MNAVEHGVDLWKLWTKINGDRGYLRTTDGTFRWARDRRLAQARWHP